MEEPEPVEDDVVRVEAQDLVRVLICYRKVGPPGTQEPHGTPKLETLLPRACLKQLETARQFKTPGQPNVNIVFENRVIRPVVGGALALGDDGELSPAIQDEELRMLEVRREALRLDINRLETTLNQLTEQHIRLRKNYSEEEQRLQAGVAGVADQLKKLRESYTAEDALVHDRLSKVLEMEKVVTGSVRDRIIKYDEDLTGAVNRESAVNNRIEDLVQAARDRAEGGSLERIFTRFEKNAVAAASSDVGQKLLMKIVNLL